MTAPSLTLHALERWRERFAGDEASLARAVAEARRLTRAERGRVKTRRDEGATFLAHDALGALFVLVGRGEARRVVTVVSL